MDYAVVVIIEVLYAISVLALISAGLAVIFGMMRVINLAHGEFLILGSYAAIFSNRYGVPIYLAILVAAPLAGAIWGFLVERLHRALALWPAHQHHARHLGLEPCHDGRLRDDFRQYADRHQRADPGLHRRRLSDQRL